MSGWIKPLVGVSAWNGGEDEIARRTSRVVDQILRTGISQTELGGRERVLRRHVHQIDFRVGVDQDIGHGIAHRVPLRIDRSALVVGAWTARNVVVARELSRWSVDQVLVHEQQAVAAHEGLPSPLLIATDSAIMVGVVHNHLAVGGIGIERAAAASLRGALTGGIGSYVEAATTKGRRDPIGSAVVQSLIDAARELVDHADGMLFGQDAS